MMEVTITSAVDLSSKQLETIKAAVTKKYGKTVTFNEVVDPTVVGGVSIRVGSQELNATVRGKLDQVQAQLLATI